MKVYCLFSILLVVLCTTFAKNIAKKRDEEVNSKLKRSVSSDECKYINSMLGEDEYYECCVYMQYDWGIRGIKCENGHIIEM